MLFFNLTEMDAAIRVAHVLLVVCKDIYESTQQQVKIHCQPKLGDHPMFLICTNDEKPKLIIEITRSRISTSLCLKAQETAHCQMLREVHIVTEKVNNIPFLLTNFQSWSFGVAQRSR